MTTREAVRRRATAQSAGERVSMVELPQRFDVHEVAAFEALVAPMSTGGTVLVIDASQVRYMDRTAMDYLLQARLRCMDHGGDLVLWAPSVAARVILELSARYEALNPQDEDDWQDQASPIEVAA
ncbi:MAG: STAS domain-containing protein [Mycobacterium sp.]|nr:STAS domain-containing protein [Mycobacterium sp.]